MKQDESQTRGLLTAFRWSLMPTLNKYPKKQQLSPWLVVHIVLVKMFCGFFSNVFLIHINTCQETSIDVDKISLSLFISNVKAFRAKDYSFLKRPFFVMTAEMFCAFSLQLILGLKSETAMHFERERKTKELRGKWTWVWCNTWARIW